MYKRQAQRGTSFSFNGSSGYTVDRFNFTQTSGATGDCTITQEADAPSNTGLVKSVKIAVDTSETPTSSGNCVFEQGIEGFNCAPLEHGQSSPPSATLSFWVKSNKTGTYSVQIKAQGSTGRYVLFDYTISSANTWEKKTITWVGDTSIALNYDNSNQLRVIWHLSSGPDDKVSPTSSWVTSSSLQMSSNAVNFFDSASSDSLSRIPLFKIYSLIIVSITLVSHSIPVSRSQATSNFALCAITYDAFFNARLK